MAGTGAIRKRHKKRGKKRQGHGSAGDGAGEGGSTIPDPADRWRLIAGLWGRRVLMVVLTAFLLAGLLGYAGVRETTVRDARGPVELTVTYAAISRSGLGTPWQVAVQRDDGFDGPDVVVRTSAAYFALFDENGFDPDPTSTSQDDEWITWTFAAPPGGADTLVVDFDARIAPSTQRGRTGVTEVLDARGNVLASVQYRTRIMP